MNKLILTLFLFLFAAFTVKAQTEAGKTFLGGSFSYYSYNNSDRNSEDKNKQVNIQPIYGIFLADNWAVSISPQYQYTKQTYNTNGTNTSTYRYEYVGGGLGFRYYWTIIPQLALYPQVAGNYLVSVGDGASSSKIFAVNASPNLAFFATKNLAFTLAFGSIYYSRQTDKPSSVEPYRRDGSYTNFSFNVASIAGVGITYHFNK